MHHKVQQVSLHVEPVDRRDENNVSESLIMVMEIQTVERGSPIPNLWMGEGREESGTVVCA